MSEAAIAHPPLRTGSPPSLSRGTTLLFAAAAGASVANVYYAQPLLDALAREFSLPESAVGGVVTASAILGLDVMAGLLGRKRKSGAGRADRSSEPTCSWL